MAYVSLLGGFLSAMVVEDILSIIRVDINRGISFKALYSVENGDSCLVQTV